MDPNLNESDTVPSTGAGVAQTRTLQMMRVEIPAGQGQATRVRDFSVLGSGTFILPTDVRGEFLFLSPPLAVADDDSFMETDDDASISASLQNPIEDILLEAKRGGGSSGNRNSRGGTGSGVARNNGGGGGRPGCGGGGGPPGSGGGGGDDDPFDGVSLENIGGLDTQIE
jgi:hypothetical protein